MKQIIPPICMTMLDALDDKQQLNKIIHDMPVYDLESIAIEANKNGNLPDGQCFLIADENGWKAAIFVKGKMPYVFYEKGVHDPARLEILKRKGVARLLHIADTKWIPTASMPYLPQRYENVETGKVLFTAEAVESELEDARNDNEVIDEELGKDTRLHVEEEGRNDYYPDLENRKLDEQAKEVGEGESVADVLIPEHLIVSEAESVPGE